MFIKLSKNLKNVLLKISLSLPPNSGIINPILKPLQIAENVDNDRIKKFNFIFN